jgi:hypothetical protein
MALAHHRQAKVAGNATTAYYEKAARLYDVLLKALEKLSDDDDALHQLMVWKALVLNNRAYLYHEHAEYQKCEACLEELLVLLQREPGLLYALPPHIASAININIFHRRSPCAASAA